MIGEELKAREPSEDSDRHLNEQHRRETEQHPERTQVMIGEELKAREPSDDSERHVTDQHRRETEQQRRESGTTDIQPGTERVVSGIAFALGIAGLYPCLENDAGTLYVSVFSIVTLTGLFGLVSPRAITVVWDMLKELRRRLL